MVGGLYDPVDFTIRYYNYIYKLSLEEKTVPQKGSNFERQRLYTEQQENFRGITDATIFPTNTTHVRQG